MSLLQRSLDPEKTLGLVDVLYTSIFDLNRWKERKSVPVQSLLTVTVVVFSLCPATHSPGFKTNNNKALL